MNLEDIFIKQIMVGPMMNYSYLVGDKSTKAAALIDPGWEGARLMNEVSEAGFSLTHILATHTHFDHANEVHYIAGKMDVKVCVHESEASVFGNIPNVMKVGDGDIINVGNLAFKVIHTPGHTPGSVCFVVDSALFTGDTLFIDGIGRTDLAGGDSEQMYNSLARLRQLPDKMVVFPGHEYGPSPTATIGEQKKTNSYLQCTSVSDFLRIV